MAISTSIPRRRTFIAFAGALVSYDTPSRYADAFRVSTPSGQVLGERKLLHDHQNEQPFTRDLHGVRIPASISIVMVRARDQKHGYGGKSVQVQLPGR